MTLSIPWFGAFGSLGSVFGPRARPARTGPLVWMAASANKPGGLTSNPATEETDATKGGSAERRPPAGRAPRGGTPESATPAPPDAPEGKDDDAEDVRELVRGLVTRAKKGDRAAYQELVTRYQKRVFGILFGMLHSREDAMELSQDVFIKVYQRIGEFEEKSSFYTWVYRIAVNLAIDFRRREWKKVHTEYDDSVADQGVDDGIFQRERGSPEDAARNRQLGERIQQALEKLPEEQKAVLVMREIDGLSYQEMADVMNCSIGTIMSRLFYARKKMQAALKGLKEGTE